MGTPGPLAPGAEKQGSLLSLCKKALELLFWTWGPGDKSLPTREVPGSTLPEATFRTCPGGQWVCGPGECRRMGGQWRDSWGGAGGGWGSGRTPRLGRTCLSSTGEEQVPASASHEAPTPRGRFALVLPGHGFCDHCCQSSSALCVPAPSGLPLPLACLSLICSLCQSPQREYPLPGQWQAASVRPLKAEPALRACTSPRLHPQPTSTSSNLRGPGSGSETQPALKYVIRCTSLKSRGQLQAQACWVRCQRPSPSSDTGCLPGP